MAKRKAKKKTRRRRRVGAMAMNASSPLVIGGAAIAGFLLGGSVNGLINSLIPAGMKANAGTGKIVSVVQMGAGAALLLLKGRKSMPKSILAGLLLGTGAKRASIVFKPGATDTLGGYGQVPVIGRSPRLIHGYGEVPVIGAYAPNSALNGAYAPNSSLNGSAKIMGTMNPSGSALMG